MHLQTAKFTCKIAIYAKITRFFNERKLCWNLRDRMENVTYRILI